MEALVIVVWTALIARAGEYLAEKIREARGRKTALMAVATEIATICFFVREFGILASYMDAGNGHGGDGYRVFDLRADYFSMYRTMSGKLEQLPPVQTSAIVRFYFLANVIIDTTRFDGGYRNLRGMGALRASQFTAAVLQEMLRVGDQIVQFPSPNVVVPPLAPYPW